jgi:5-oxoprolinase (ATP-hydrolysing)
MRYEGTDTAVMLAQPPDNDFERALRQTYIREYGSDLKGRPILIDDIRVRALGKTNRLRKIPIAPAQDPPLAEETVDCYFKDGWLSANIYHLNSLKAGHHINGPAIIIHETTTILVEPDALAEITEFGDVVINVTKQKEEKLDTAANPIRLSIFSNLFMSIAEQMGRMLQKTAISTNIKERLDFSCAVFDSNGDLVANAPHVPVHLGAMSDAVKAQIRIRKEDIVPGDVLVSNHPSAGGSHLPDITVMTPVFESDTIIFWVAARGHHADIGGISPGSMPAGSRRLEEEGACIESFKLVKNGRFQEHGIRKLLLAPGNIKSLPGKPDIKGARRVQDNMSDLKAQVAANQKGIELLKEMVKRYGLDVVQAYMGHVQDAAEAAVRDRLRELSLANNMDPVDTVHAVDYMDDGSPIALALTIDREKGGAVFDFAGTGSEVTGNCNAPKAVTTSAILYSLRSLIKKELPLNHGCLIPIEIKIPKGSLLDPSPQAAVVGGNVLTSQRIVDVILKALNVAAASQGCMNNFTFGNDRFGYYETIGGGAGAGPSWHGKSGVHTHMTNTRITDPEILERRYPVLLREFALRRGSGGKGQFNGGDGLVREVEFLEPLNAAILSERRVYAPYGLKGGDSGKRGINLFIEKDGQKIDVSGKNEVNVQPGDRFRIETPGGGGYGKK